MEDILVTIAFYVLAIICFIGAMGVVFNKTIVNSALLLLLTFLGIAGLFLLLNSDFVAMAQILIYSVGISIIVIFAIMLTVPEAKQESILKRPRGIISFITCMLLLLVLFLAILSNNFMLQLPNKLTIQRLLNEGTAGIIGKSMFSTYVLPFEIVSVLLLVAIVGAVILARRKAEVYDEE
jgi:NADH-quinone oxidoreductase subunit J